MDKLKTDLKEIKQFSKPLDRSKTITLGCPKTFAFREFKTVWFLHDALCAHTLEERIDKGVNQIQKIISVVEAGTFHLSAGEETALLYDLRSTKAILREGDK